MTFTEVDPNTNRSTGEREGDVKEPRYFRCDCGSLLLERQKRGHVCERLSAVDFAGMRIFYEGEAAYPRMKLGR